MARSFLVLCCAAALGARPCSASLAPIKLNFSEATMVHNNLGGLGPGNTTDNTGVIKYTFPDGASLSFWNISEYRPYDTRNNGVAGMFGAINLANGECVQLEAKVTVPGHDTRPTYYISLFDIDGSLDGKYWESVTAKGFRDYFVAEDTQLELTRDSQGYMQVKSTVRNGDGNNPVDPRQLSPLQSKQVVTFHFIQQERFEMKLCVEGPRGGKGGRDILLAGSSALVATAEPTCATTGQKTVHEAMLDFKNGKCTANNLGGLGPRTMDTPSIVYNNIGMIGDRPIDLSVTALSPYAGVGVNNGYSGYFGAVSVMQSSSVDLLFKFTDSETGGLAAPANFYFGLYDFDHLAQGSSQMSATVWVDGLHYQAGENISATNVTGGATFQSVVIGRPTDNAKDPAIMNALQKSKSVFMRLSGISEFNMTLAVGAGPEGTGRNFEFSGWELAEDPTCAPDPDDPEALAPVRRKFLGRQGAL